MQFHAKNLTHFTNLNSPVWLNVWVFVYELSGCGFESSCSHFNSLNIAKKKFSHNTAKNLTLQISR